MQRGEAAKVYNLSSAGKALPGWLSAKRRRSLQRESAAGRLEVVQNLQFPTACARVKVSADGETLMATGAYPPQLRAYELRELSMKYQYHFVSDVVQFQILSPDWKKAVFLLSDRTLQFHSQFGKHHATRIPHFGRALAYQRETCELLVGGDRIARLAVDGEHPTRRRAIGDEAAKAQHLAMRREETEQRARAAHALGGGRRKLGELERRLRAGRRRSA